MIPLWSTGTTDILVLLVIHFFNHFNSRISRKRFDSYKTDNLCNTHQQNSSWPSWDLRSNNGKTTAGRRIFEPALSTISPSTILFASALVIFIRRANRHSKQYFNHSNHNPMAKPYISPAQTKLKFLLKIEDKISDRVAFRSDNYWDLKYLWLWQVMKFLGFQYMVDWSWIFFKCPGKIPKSVKYKNQCVMWDMDEQLWWQSLHFVEWLYLKVSK